MNSALQEAAKTSEEAAMNAVEFELVEKMGMGKFIESLCKFKQYDVRLDDYTLLLDIFYMDQRNDNALLFIVFPL